MYPRKKKVSAVRSFDPYGWCEFIPARQNELQKTWIIFAEGVQEAFQVSYLPVEDSNWPLQNLTLCLKLNMSKLGPKP